MKRKTDDLVIGRYCYSYDCCDFISWGQLKKTVAEGKSAYKLIEYTNFTKVTNLLRFNYDPWTGDKIPWDKIRKEAENLDK